MLFWTIRCWTNRRLLQPGQHHFRDQSYNIPWGAGARGKQPFRRPSTAARQGQQQGQSCQQRGQPQQQQGQGGSNRRGRRSHSNRNESAPGGSAFAARQWDVAGRGSPDKFCPAVLGDCRASYTLGNGVQLEWESLPPLHSTRNTSKDLQTTVAKLLSKGAIEAVFRPETKGFFSRRFLVPKKTGDVCPVIDLSRLIDHLVIPRFKMETQASVQAFIRENEWTVSIDIQDAYLHVPMARSVWKYLRFMVNGHVYQFTCFPFGLATSPREFTKLLRPVVQLLRLPRYQAPCISGRLAHPSIVHRTGQNSCRFSPAGVITTWMGNQFQQVRLGSQPAVRFYRHVVQHVRLHRGTSTQNAGQNPEHPGSLEITPAHIYQSAISASHNYCREWNGE